MNKFNLFCTTAIGLLSAMPAMAQTQAPTEDDSDTTIEEIIVTAQRRSETLQNVPIAVSAFSGEALETRQINNASDLQLSLPNITFSKTNFYTSSFTIRGIGDLCVGVACDSATGIHVNDMPLLGSRLFETEYFDLERIEVLRGPQGTLFGRNATSGVVNVITAKPSLTEFAASGEVELGNYNSVMVKGMINIPLSDTIGLRAAGYYLNRGGYTTNVANGQDIDGRDLFALRGTLRWQPSPDTTLDIIGYYFREKDDRSRIQKQLCHRDPTGVLGCLPDRLANEVVNGNSTLGTILSSREFFRIAGGAAGPLLTNYGLASIYGPDLFLDQQPESVRQVRLDFAPTYFADELHVMGKLTHDFGPVDLNVTGGYARASVDSRTDYFLNAASPFDTSPGSGLDVFRNGLGSAVPAIGSTPVGRALLDGNGNICVSEVVGGVHSGFGGGFRNSCSASDIEYDRSYQPDRQYSIEAHIDSEFDGPLNFLLGGIYLDSKSSNEYFVTASGIDYSSAVLGYAVSLDPALGAAPGSLFLGAPFFDNETKLFKLRSYGLFGEVYYDISDKLKLTGGLRYSNDRKFVQDRNVILNFPVPVGTTDIFASPYAGGYDADVGTPGNQIFREQTVGFSEITGRFVIDWKPSDDSLLYASYSRGYKSGGVNPPFNPVLFTAPATFDPEIITAFEIGSKNTMLDGTVQLNASAFYYKYKGLQLSRIINRTSFNDNTDADIWGAELEAVVKPDPAWLFNLSASYLKTKIKEFALVDTRDPSAGRSDTVIIKDITNASNCVVIPSTAGNATGSNAFVNTINSTVLGLQPTTPVPGTSTTGAYSVCGILGAAAAGNIAAVNPALAALQPLLDSFGTFTVRDGIPISLTGNQLPQAPTWKFSAGAQYTTDFSNGMNLVLRADMAYTGEYFGRSFNRPIDKINGYAIINMSAQLNGAKDRWFVRGFVQNLANNNAVTGQYLTDPATGLFTNIFTLEPRRYGIASGFKF